MVYVDVNGNQLESVDLTKGRLVDAEWVEHPAVEQVGHYEYADLDGGGRLQTYVVDTPAQSAWSEVTVQKYIPYTEEELAFIAKSDYGSRLEALEALGRTSTYRLDNLETASASHSETNDLLSAQIMAVSDRGDFVEDCLAEMAEVVYA